MKFFDGKEHKCQACGGELITTSSTLTESCIEQTAYCRNKECNKLYTFGFKIELAEIREENTEEENYSLAETKNKNVAEEKEEWILRYIENKKVPCVDILDEEFVTAYIEKFKVNYEPMLYGAHRCKELGKLLSKMYKQGKLERCTQGVRGLTGEDFPKWVYCYYISRK